MLCIESRDKTLDSYEHILFFLGLKMAQNTVNKLLAKSNFIAGLDEKLAVVDAYTKQTRDVVNKVQNIAKMIDADIANILRGGNIIDKAFPIIDKYTGTELTINKDNLVARLTGFSKSVTNQIKSMGDGLIDKISNVTLFNDVYSSVDGVLTKITSTAYDGLGSVAQLVNDITGSPNIMKIIDKDSTSAVYIGLIKEATEKGIPNSFKAIVNAIDDKTILNKVIGGILPDVIKNSDIKMLASITEWDSSSVSRLLDTDLINKVASKYEFGFGYDEGTDVAAIKDLTTSFDSIKSDWKSFEVVENGTDTELPNALTVILGSSGFKEGILNYIKNDDTVKENDTFLALGTVFYPTTVESQLQSLFPFNIKSNSNAESNFAVTPQFTI